MFTVSHVQGIAETQKALLTYTRTQCGFRDVMIRLPLHAKKKKKKENCC